MLWMDECGSQGIEVDFEEFEKSLVLVFVVEVIELEGFSEFELVVQIVLMFLFKVMQLIVKVKFLGILILCVEVV